MIWVQTLSAVNWKLESDLCFEICYCLFIEKCSCLCISFALLG